MISALLKVLACTAIMNINAYLTMLRLLYLFNHIAIFVLYDSIFIIVVASSPMSVMGISSYT